MIKKTLFLFLTSFIVIIAKAGTNNIARLATITASSISGKGFEAKNIADGLIGIDGMGEWACEGDTTDWGYIRFPWIQLEWQQPQLINKVVLYDRASLRENIAGGKLIFSDGSIVWVNQIPADGTGLAVTFETKKTKWIKFEATDGSGRELGFSEIEVFPSPEQQKDYVSWVDPYIETNRGRDIFFITGSLPFGMATAAPMTRNKNQNGGSYNYNEKQILGFEQIHAWMQSGIEIMPASDNENPVLGQQGWKSFYNHDDEIVQPGYHRVMLQNNKIWVEQTSTERVNFYRFRYTKATKGRIIINLSGHIINCTMANAVINRVSDTVIEGSFSTVDRYWGGPKDVKIFFTIHFDKPFKSLDAWEGNNFRSNVSKASGDSLRLGAEYDLDKGETVQMKIGISYTTIENAKNNLAQECSQWDFDAVRTSAQNIWNDWLGKIDVSGGDYKQRIKFYTDLWHVLLGRQKINDINGDYPDRTTGKREGTFTDAIFKIKTVPKDASGKPKYNMYSSDAVWLTQWNLNVLWGLAWPQVLDDISASFIQYADNGYLLPRGPSGGGYSYIMTSCPATNMIASAYLKGILTKANAQHAFETVKRNALPGGMLGDSADIDFYTKHGWWPNNAGITVEATFQDWGISQMALKLGRKKDYSFFKNRSGGWKNLFEPDQKLLFPKDKNGNFMHHDALSGEGWVEANAWQATWGVSHAIPQLMQKMGGSDSFCNKLNYAFEQSRDVDFVYGYSNGYISYANQPGCSDAHVFSYGGKPWLTQYWVRRVREQAFNGTTPDLGYGGHDEDQGQMGGVSSLMAIGLFDIMGNESVSPVYEITSPIFDEITIKLDKRYYSGDKFVIKTHNNSSNNPYIQSAKLNDQKLNNFWLTHDTFTKGGTLELWLGDKPNKQWGTGALPPAFIQK
ncbi:GH92 family glycosyl hydrolase [Ferruginibacter albus]|uniref:GH92 family glycosyl hydrolase n=1 Tax=Ferruginibacter albus TaxID=2875540 RepID=UPI001CC4F495|nr:GH92 family glycosyl hydrolase [Ferruginibacter albus]UAY51929.1 GH92 family glycosyl hydrolase [Ferruginibacter albus]